MRPRWVTLGAGLVAVAVVGGFRVPVHADDAAGSGFQSLSLSATATSQRVIADQVAGQPPGTADSGVPDAEVTMTASTGHALASAVWPTALVGNAGSLLYLLGPNPCTPDIGPIAAQCSPVAIPTPVLNQYHYLNDPVRAEAQYPTKPHDVNDIPGATMQASADPGKVSADAVVGAETSSDAYAFGTTHASSTVALTGPAQATADALSSVSNISFAGGAISIGSLDSEAHATTDGKVAQSRGSTTVHNMSVNGIPVYIDSTGVHGGSADVPDAAATGAVNQILDKFGLTAYLTKPMVTTKGGATTYSAASLVVVWDTAPSKPGTMDVVFVFGGAQVTASANLPFSLPATPDLSAGSSLAGGSGNGAASDLGSTSGSSAGSSSGPLSSASAGLPIAGGNGAASSAALPSLAASHAAIPGVGVNPWWVILALLGTAIFAGGFRRMPDRMMDQPLASPCDLGGEP